MDTLIQELCLLWSLGTGKKDKKLAIMDQDGGNVQILSDGKNGTHPRFDPSSHRIAYLSYSNNIPQVFLFDLYWLKKASWKL